MNRRVGFIGIGDQGAAMAVAIAEQHELHVWARRDSAYAALGEAAFLRADNPRTLSESVTVLCLCLPGDAELRQLLLEDGAADALAPGSIVVNHATGDPDAAIRMADALAERDIRYLDAPVSGGRPGAEARTLTCFVGGDASVLEACRPVLACHSSTIAHMGGAGAGQMTKLVNNALTVSNLRNIVEVFRLAKAGGLHLPAVQQALAESSGGSFILQALGRKITPEIAEHIAGLNRKDVIEFADAMRHRGLDPSDIAEWAIAGPDGLPALVDDLAGKAPASADA